MKITVKAFGIMVGTTEVKFAAGVYRVPEDMTHDAALMAIKMGLGRWVAEKVAPENKAFAVAENKSELERPVRRRRKRAEPDAGGGDEG